MGEKTAIGMGQVLQGVKLSKYVYWKTIEFMKTNNTTEEIPKFLWEHEFNLQLMVKEWDKIQNDAFKLVLAMKLRYFQYMHIQRHLKTNIQIAKWKPDKSNRCTFCEGKQ